MPSIHARRSSSPLLIFFFYLFSLFQSTIPKSSAHNDSILFLEFKTKGCTTHLVSFTDLNQTTPPLPVPGFPQFCLSAVSQSRILPWAMRSFTSRSTGVDTTDLVRTSTFSRPITTTRYGNISLEETEAELRRSMGKKKGKRQVWTLGVEVRRHHPVPQSLPSVSHCDKEKVCVSSAWGRNHHFCKAAGIPGKGPLWSTTKLVLVLPRVGTEPFALQHRAQQ